MVTAFRKASKQYYEPGDKVFIDEQLILFKGRSRHTMQIGAREAGQGFKINCLCDGIFLYFFVFASNVCSLDYLEISHYYFLYEFHPMSPITTHPMIFTLCQTHQNPGKDGSQNASLLKSFPKLYILNIRNMLKPEARSLMIDQSEIHFFTVA